MKPIVLSVTALTVLALLATASHAAQPVTGCGVDIEGDAYLVGDLDCTGVDLQPNGFSAITLRGRATLELGGYSIHGVYGTAVTCDGRCSIVGPGAMYENYQAIRAIPGVRMNDVSISASTGLGATIEGDGLRLENCHVSGGNAGIHAGRRLLLRDSDVTGTDNYGVDAGFRLARHLPCKAGVVVLVNSDVSGNMLNPQNDSAVQRYADIVSCARPRLDNESSCGTSRLYQSTDTWSAWDPLESTCRHASLSIL